jgi:RNA polymerase sigma-70 factor, ECF subfamily
MLMGIVVDKSNGKTATKVDTPVTSDIDLVELSLRGDKLAYRQLFEKYSSRLIHVAFDVVKNREDAEDIVQEAFVKAYLSLGSFKGASSFYTWIYRIVINLAVDLRRKLSRRGGDAFEYDETVVVGKGGSLNESSDGGSSGINSNQNVNWNPMTAFLRKQQSAKISEALNSLSEEHRRTILLREFDGLSYEEISEATGVNLGTVMSRLYYARKRLQQLLHELMM